MDPATLSPAESRLLEDLAHQEGSSGIEDAIKAGRSGGARAPSNICWKCGEAAVTVRTVYDGTIRTCVKCGATAKGPCGPTVTGATPVRQPDPIPTVHMDPNVDYLPDKPPGFRHPGKNFRSEDS